MTNMGVQEAVEGWSKVYGQEVTSLGQGERSSCFGEELAGAGLRTG